MKNLITLIVLIAFVDKDILQRSMKSAKKSPASTKLASQNL
jgi:hypothetical protein